MKINYFDIHSHLESPKFDKDREEVISRMQDEGIFTITIGTDLENSKKAVRVADKYENIFASIGLHPTDTDEDFVEEDYIELVKNPKVVAVGECGLEFFRLGEDAEEEKQRQIDIFTKQIDFAVRYDKPLMIHCRDAHTEVLSLLDDKKREYGDKLRGNIHFFSGDVELAKRYIDLGFTISFTGVITFARACSKICSRRYFFRFCPKACKKFFEIFKYSSKFFTSPRTKSEKISPRANFRTYPQYDDVIREIPLDKIMSETDAPFVAPEPYRGKRCEPLYVKEVVKRIAEIKGMDEEEVEKKMVENATNFFRIKN